MTIGQTLPPALHGDDLAPWADYVLAEAEFPELPGHYRGKVRDNYDLPDGRRILIASDRISAFDRELAAIPLKGQVLTALARFWFERTADILPSHVLDWPDPNVLVARRLEMAPVEVVVRDYLAGTTSTSILTLYGKGERRLYGIDFPDGLRPNQKLPQTILTPTTKAAHGEHDAPISGPELVGAGLLTQSRWDEMAQAALALFARGREEAARRGLILVDTKYEFGYDGAGRLTLADEVHTPDSSRYWLAENYPEAFAAGAPPQALDKDFIRRWVAARCDPYREPVPPIPRGVLLEAAAVYLDAHRRLTGEALPLPATEPAPFARVRANLARYLG